jgi:hypothetical protein
MMTARKIAKAMKKVIPCNRIGVAVVGLEVPHTHIHLMPINAVSDMNFKNPPISLSVDEYERTCDMKYLLLLNRIYLILCYAIIELINQAKLVLILNMLGKIKFF